MTVHTFPKTRPLSVVIAELMLAKAEQQRFYNLRRDPTESEDKRISQVDDIIWLRTDEAKALIETLTGVSWDNLYEVMN